MTQNLYRQVRRCGWRLAALVGLLGAPQVPLAAEDCAHGCNHHHHGEHVHSASDTVSPMSPELLATLASLSPEARARALPYISPHEYDRTDISISYEGYVMSKCAPVAMPAGYVLPAPAPGPAAAPVPIASPPAYNSKPGATNVIYLDFNGATITGTAWNSSVTSYDALPYNLDGDATTFSDTEQTAIRRIWERVAEDFAPFDVNVTTVEPTTFTRTTGTILITRSQDGGGTNMPSSGGGGVAYVDVFGISNYHTYYSPALVYFDNLGSGREDFVAEAASHEIGHNFGLSHHGTSSDEYYDGHGSGETSWAAIMGVGYNQNVSQWSDGGYTDADNASQDDLAIIENDLGYRTDDVGNSSGTASPLGVTAGSVSSSGIVERSTDVDVWSFSLARSGDISLTITPWQSEANTDGGNLDIKAVLYDNDGSTVLQTYDDATQVDAAISATGLATGTYYLSIEGDGTGNPLAATPTGYTDYASIGQYTISGTINVTNATPTDIVLSNDSVEEDRSIGTTVGVLSATDADAGETFTFSLVSGTGDTDNASFSISGTSLLTAEVFDFNVKSSYSIRVRVTDSIGASYDEVFTITIDDGVNDAPTDIALSSSTIEERQPSGSLVGILSVTDPDVSDSHTFALISGVGDTDNASFSISGTNLLSAEVFERATKSSYSIRVLVTDAGSLTYEEVFTITISDANDPPTDIALSSQSVLEDQPSGTTVGTLSVADPDTADTATYSLVAGDGSTDNGAFNISGANLQTAQVFDYTTKSSYSIRIRVTDSGGLSYEESFAITIVDIEGNRAPTDISLAGSSVLENQPSGTLVGTLSATDPDNDDTATFSLVSGTGDSGNASFTITGGNLTTNEVFDRETKSVYSIRVRVTDSISLTYEEVFSIVVLDGGDAPTAVVLADNSVNENSVTATVVGTLTTTDTDQVDSHTYSLVSGSGDTDNSAFDVSGASLITNAVFDYETKSTYSIRVRTTDSTNQSHDEILTVSITDINEAPSVTNLGVIRVELGATTMVSTAISDPEDDNSTLTLSASVSESNVSITAGPSNNAGNAQLTLSGDTVGQSTLTLTVTDSANQSTDYAVQVIVFEAGDTVAPVATLTNIVFTGYAPNGTTGVTVNGVVASLNMTSGKFTTTLNNPGVGGTVEIIITNIDGSTQTRSIEITGSGGSL